MSRKKNDSADTSGWSWWWSKDEERYQGPFTSRALAIMDAFGEDEKAVHVMQAEQGPYRADLYDADRLAEQFDDANHDLGDGDGDPPSTSIPVEVWKSIAGRLNNQVQTAVLRHCPTSWAFNGQTSGEWVDLSVPTIAALPPEARQIIAGLASCFAENACSPHYVTAEIERLKGIMAPQEVAKPPA